MGDKNPALSELPAPYNTYNDPRKTFYKVLVLRGCKSGFQALCQGTWKYLPTAHQEGAVERQFFFTSVQGSFFILCFTSSFSFRY